MCAQAHEDILVHSAKAQKHLHFTWWGGVCFAFILTLLGGLYWPGVPQLEPLK